MPRLVITSIFENKSTNDLLKFNPGDIPKIILIPFSLETLMKFENNSNQF